MSIKYPYTDFHEMNLDWTLETVKKADENAENAVLQADMTADYVRNYFNNLDLTQEVSDILNEMVTDGSISALIDPVILSTLPPEVVNSVSDMSNINKTYILKSDSHIYQYSGGTWNDTGVVYGSSIGNVLTFYGTLASGTLFEDLPTNSIYYRSSSVNPADAPDSGPGTIITLMSTQQTAKQQFYTRLSTGNIWYRSFSNNAWGSWFVIAGQDAFTYIGSVSANYDANTEQVQTCKYITTPANTVLNIPEYNSGFLFTMGSAYTRFQMYAAMKTGVVYSRTYISNTWSDWITGSLTYRGVAHTTDDLLPGGDCNNAPGMSMYLCQTGSGIYNRPIDRGAYLITIGQTGTARSQFFITWYEGDTYFRRSTSNNAPTWTAWIHLTGNEGKNPNAHMFATGNSIMAGSVWTNGSYDHLSAYNNAPYSVVANAIGIPKDNVDFELHSSTGLLYDAGDGNFLDIITNTDISSYDVVMTQLYRLDMNYNLGSAASTAGDGTIAGAVKALVNYIVNNNGNCQLILWGAPPTSNTIYGNNVFTGNYPNGKNLADCEALMTQLAKDLHFTFIGWQDMGLSYRYLSQTDNNNVHANNENTYRIMGAYAGGRASAEISF